MSKALMPMQGRGVVGEAALYDGRMLDLIRRTVAKECNQDEFDLFISMCRSLRLDPLRKQAYAFVFKKRAKKGKNGQPDEPEQRTLTLVTSINGFRTIADRTGTYRPSEDGPELTFDDAEKCATNPTGLVSAKVCVWKFAHGAWHRVTETAFWAEYAPIKDEWAEDETGKWRTTGKRTLDTSGQWGKMPRVMLAKVAEAAALRKAFPDELSNVHADEEVDREKFLDLTPTEAVEAIEEHRRLERIGGRNTLIVDFLKGEMAPLDIVPEGQFADRVVEFVEIHKDNPSQVVLFRERNANVLRQFWASHPSDALELKKKLEEAIGA